MTKILLIYTGGTIGMIKNPITGELESFNFKHIHDHVPELNRLNVQIESISFNEPIDSSEMNLEHWRLMSELVDEHYHLFDGFVILHGSDTMAFSASALSFMLQGLKKPIVFTGSQLPIGTIRTDGKENLITAIEIAGMKDSQGEAILQEVAVYFEYSLYRGNRSSKISANQFEAFQSPNYPELAKAGVQIEWQKDRLFRTELSEFKVFTSFKNNVALIRLFPGMNFEFYRSIFADQQVEAIVLETYGSGNAPSDVLFQELVTSFLERGGIVLNITQCGSGAVQQGAYQTSSFFERMGVISGRNLTSEAAITKLMYLLGSTSENIREKLQESLVGEMD
ncbi:MAG: asparaginase [Crocinitomicaceae bacterium]|jgi:L-asparaginase|nr:asparaginase [Crocinitomicaceae bacterium]